MNLNKEQKKVLNALLDKYERSKSYVEGKTPVRRIQLNFYNDGKCDFSEYDIENTDARVIYNDAVIELKKIGLVDYSWMRGQERHLIGKVWLMPERTREIYQFAERVPKADYVDSILLLLMDALDHITAPWAKKCVEQWISTIEKSRTVGAFLPSASKEIEEFLKVMIAASQPCETGVLERVFSTRCLGDSKKFEKLYRGRLIRILKKYSPNEIDAEGLNEEETLSQIGIEKYPEQIAFCGKMKLKLPCGTTDFAPLQSGAYLNVIVLRDGELIVDESVNRVLMIENKANYVDYVLNRRKLNELVVFHGGCYSPAKEKFFMKLKCATPPRVVWYHWSDIDLGGFQMLARLRKNINPAILPYRMDEKELREHYDSTKPITRTYLEKLKSLMKFPELVDCLPCITFMLKHSTKLEQENLID